MLATTSTVWGRTLACTLLIQTKSLLGKTKKQSAFGSTQKQRETFKTIFLTLVMWGTLKQEVDRHKEEAALFDNTKWCKDTAKYDTCRTHTHTDNADKRRHFQQKTRNDIPDLHYTTHHMTAYTAQTDRRYLPTYPGSVVENQNVSAGCELNDIPKNTWVSFSV